MKFAFSQKHKRNDKNSKLVDENRMNKIYRFSNGLLLYDGIEI